MLTTRLQQSTLLWQSIRDLLALPNRDLLSLRATYCFVCEMSILSPKLLCHSYSLGIILCILKSMRNKSALLEAAHQTGTCGLKSSGELWCWGSLDNSGQIFTASAPERLDTNNADQPYHLLAAADRNVCMAYGPDGSQDIGCLGFNEWGLVSPELGANQMNAFGFTPTHTDVGNVTSLDVHRGTGCFVAGGQSPQISCWGKSADFRTATRQPAEFFPQQ